MSNKPSGITGLNTGWAHYSNLVFSLILDEGSGIPVDSTGGATVNFSGDIAWATAPDGDPGVKVGAGAPVPIFNINSVPARAAGTIVQMVYVNSADTTNVSRLFSDSGTENLELNRQGPSNTQLEVGSNAVSNFADVTIWETTGYKVITSTWDNQAIVSGEGRSIYIDGTQSFNVDDTLGGAAHVAPLNIMSQPLGNAPFVDAYLVGMFALDKVLTPSDVTTLIADEWAWIAATGGSPVPVLANHHMNMMRG
ncbi:MAG TPA: hypothetical protein ENJ35_04185 [Gammaproteobacteria bacterium]|nr:hypothetical protein [Gammaproteobacteria bacterium]